MLPEVTVCRLIQEGVNFVLKNTELFDLREPQEAENFIDLNADDLPF